MRRIPIRSTALGAALVFLPLARLAAAPAPFPQDPATAETEEVLVVLDGAQRQLEAKLALLDERMATTSLEEAGPGWMQAMADQRTALQAQRVQFDSQRDTIRKLAQRVAERRDVLEQLQVEMARSDARLRADPEAGAAGRRASVAAIERAQRELRQAETVMQSAVEQVLQVIAVVEPGTHAAAVTDLRELERRAVEEFDRGQRRVRDEYQRDLADLDADAAGDADATARRRASLEEDYSRRRASLHERHDMMRVDLETARTRLAQDYDRERERIEKMTKAGRELTEVARETEALRDALRSVKALEKQIALTAQQFELEEQELVDGHARALRDLDAEEDQARQRMERARARVEQRFQAERQRLDEQFASQRRDLDQRRSQLDAAASQARPKRSVPNAPSSPAPSAAPSPSPSAAPSPSPSAVASAGVVQIETVLLEMRDSVHELREEVRELRGLVRDVDRIVRGKRKAH